MVPKGSLVQTGESGAVSDRRYLCDYRVGEFPDPPPHERRRQPDVFGNAGQVAAPISSSVARFAIFIAKFGGRSG